MVASNWILNCLKRWFRFVLSPFSTLLAWSRTIYSLNQILYLLSLVVLYIMYVYIPCSPKKSCIWGQAKFMWFCPFGNKFISPSQRCFRLKTNFTIVSSSSPHLPGPWLQRNNSDRVLLFLFGNSIFFFHHHSQNREKQNQVQATLGYAEQKENPLFSSQKKKNKNWNQNTLLPKDGWNLNCLFFSPVKRFFFVPTESNEATTKLHGVPCTSLMLLPQDNTVVKGKAWLSKSRLSHRRCLEGEEP